MDDTTLSDEELILLARQGNQEAFDLLKKKYEMLSWKFAKDYYYQHRSSGISIEEYQAVVFERFFSCFKNYDDYSNVFFQYWKISANNELVHYYKANAYEAGGSMFNGVSYELDDDETLNPIEILGEPDYTMTNSILQDEYEIVMLKLIKEFKRPDDKSIINLFLDGYSPRQISKELSISSRHVYYVVKTFQEKMLKSLRKLKN